jgi:hypothetical protein
MYMVEAFLHHKAWHLSAKVGAASEAIYFFLSLETTTIPFRFRYF